MNSRRVSTTGATPFEIFRGRRTLVLALKIGDIKLRKSLTNTYSGPYGVVGTTLNNQIKVQELVQDRNSKVKKFSIEHLRIIENQKFKVIDRKTSNSVTYFQIQTTGGDWWISEEDSFLDLQKMSENFVKMEKKKRKVYLPLSTLCDDELVTIFSFMSIKELLDFSETSKQFHSVVEDFAKTINKEVIFDPWTIQKALKNQKDVDNYSNWRNKIDLLSLLKNKPHVVEGIHNFGIDEEILNFPIEEEVETELFQFNNNALCDFKKTLKKTLYFHIKRLTLELSEDVLMYFPNLEELSVYILEGCQIDLKSIAFPGWQKLRKLSLHLDIDVDPNYYDIFLNICSNIESLVVIINPDGGYFDDSFPPNMEKLKNLKSLEIESDSGSTPVANSIKDTVLNNLIDNFPYFEQLTIKHCSQIDGEIFSLIKNTSLKKLHLERDAPEIGCCDEMELYTFKNDLINLEEIQLFGFENTFKKEFLESLNEHCKNIKKIILTPSYYDKFNDEVFFELYQKNYFPNLKILNLQGVNLEKYQKLRPKLQIKLLN
eukprot:gene5276-8894_t